MAGDMNQEGRMDIRWGSINKRFNNRRVVADEKEEDVTIKLSFQFNSCANANINCFIKIY